jgi:hypothetical protein
MPRSKKNKPRHAKKVTHIRGSWLFLCVLGALGLLVLLFLMPTTVLVPILGYLVLAASILMVRAALRSGVLFARGTPVSRINEPAQFWVFLALTVGPLFGISTFVVFIHLKSLFHA